MIIGFAILSDRRVTLDMRLGVVYLAPPRASCSQRHLRQSDDMEHAHLHVLEPIRWQRNAGCFLGHDDLQASSVESVESKAEMT